MGLPGFIKKKANKYKAKKTEYNDRVYDSGAEAIRAQQLDDMKAANQILWWIPQVTIELGIPENKYRVDFLVGVNAGNGAVVVHAEDVKGFETAKFRKDMKLWKKYAPFPLHVIAKKETKVITPGQD